MSQMVETCACGAKWEGGSAYVEEREKFREAHTSCRTVRVEGDAADRIQGWVDQFDSTVRELGEHVENFGAYATKVERAESSRRNFA